MRVTPLNPAGLSKSSRRLYDQTLERFDFEPSDLALFVHALGALDRANQARTEINATGSLTVANRFGEIRPHPLLVVERDCRAQYATILKQLGLEIPEARPIRTTSYTGARR